MRYCAQYRRFRPYLPKPAMIGRAYYITTDYLPRRSINRDGILCDDIISETSEWRAKVADSTRGKVFSISICLALTA